MPLDARVRRFLDLVAATNPAGAASQSVGERRASLEQLMRLGGASPPVERVDELALPARIDLANDPFFGRVGQIVAVSQRQQALKFELLIPFQKTSSPTACMSFNYHREHFGNVWGIRDSGGETAHTGCVAFGIDRLAVALFSIHGLDTAKWPARVSKALGL